MKLVYIFVWLLIFNAISIPIVIGQSTTAKYHSNESLYISNENLEVLKLAALDGSGEAANKIATYYVFYKSDRAMGLYWLTISAENGYYLGCSNLISMLKTAPDPKLQRRAKFWERQLDEKKCPIR